MVRATPCGQKAKSVQRLIGWHFAYNLCKSTQLLK